MATMNIKSNRAFSEALIAPHIPQLHPHSLPTEYKGLQCMVYQREKPNPLKRQTSSWPLNFINDLYSSNRIRTISCIEKCLLSGDFITWVLNSVIPRTFLCRQSFLCSAWISFLVLTQMQLNSTLEVLCRFWGYVWYLSLFFLNQLNMSLGSHYRFRCTVSRDLLRVCHQREQNCTDT